MKKYIIIAGILIFGYLLAQYFKPQPTNWTPTYLREDKIPFGTYILQKQLNDIFPNTQLAVVNEPIYNNLKARKKGKSNYFIIASKVEIDQMDYREMQKYMERGNSIFIAAYEISDQFLEKLKLRIGADYSLQSKQKYPINFVNPKLRSEYDYYFDKGISNQYFTQLDTSRTIVLGLKEDRLANFIQINHGKGALYILPNPQLLTNYSLLKENGRDYAAKALSYLPEAETMIWDEHFSRPNTADSSALRVFSKYPELKWSYYIALFSLVIFVLYEIKRRQRVIPVIERPQNTSVEFVKVVGRVYYQQRDNRDIAEKKVNYFFEYIRSKYRLKTTSLDEEFKSNLIRVAGASAEIIDELFEEIRFLNAGGTVSDRQLIAMNKLIEQFYKQDQ